MLKVKIELDHPNAKMPIKGSLKAACWDVFAASINMLDTNTYEVSLGFKLEPPEGYKVVLVPRSSITKTEVIQQNSPGQGDCVPAGTLIATPAEEIPEIDLVMESVEVKSKSRKLKTEREEEVEIQKPELTFEQLKNMSHQNIKKYYEE